MKLTAILSLLLLAACATAPPSITTIVTDPPEAVIYLGEKQIGISPVEYLFDFQNTVNQVLAAKKAGYFTETREINAAMLETGLYRIEMQLVISPMWQATTISRATNDWFMVIVNPEIPKTEVWQRMIDAVTKRFPELEEFDVNSGYIKSVVKARRFTTSRGEFRLRSRFVAAVATEEPLTYKLKVISEWTDKGILWRPYVRVFKEDQLLIDELVDRFGLK